MCVGGVVLDRCEMTILCSVHEYWQPSGVVLCHAYCTLTHAPILTRNSNEHINCTRLVLHRMMWHRYYQDESCAVVVHTHTHRHTHSQRLKWSLWHVCVSHTHTHHPLPEHQQAAEPKVWLFKVIRATYTYSARTTCVCVCVCVTTNIHTHTQTHNWVTSSSLSTSQHCWDVNLILCDENNWQWVDVFVRGVMGGWMDGCSLFSR